MIENSLLDTIIYQDFLLGDFTIKDLVNYIKDINKEYKHIEQIILSILENTELTDEDISSIFRYDISSNLNFIIDVLEEKI